MLKLKITKPKTIKVKYKTHFPDIILANLQEKEVEPTTETQIIEADYGYDGLKQVEIKPIPSEYIKPTGTKEIIENGIHNVKEFENVDVNVSYTPNYQEKTVIPIKEEQEIIADEGYDALEKVIVEPIPDEYITPNGELEITENGIYDVSEFETANVATSGVNINQYMTNVPTIISNFSGVGGWITCIKKLQPLEISGKTDLRYLYAYFLGEEIDVSKINTVGVTNMSYMFSRLENVTNHLDLSHFDTSLVTTMEGMFSNIKKFEGVGQGDEYDINIENFYTPKLTSIYQMFYSSTDLKKIDISHFDTSNVTNIGILYDGDSNLTDINMSNCDFGKVASVNYMYRGCKKLVNLRIGKNVGKGYNPNNNANYYANTIDLSSSKDLTYESLMDVINNVYDIASLGCKTQQLIFGSTNLAKLTADEIAIATSKGWSVS